MRKRTRKRMGSAGLTGGQKQLAHPARTTAGGLATAIATAIATLDSAAVQETGSGNRGGWNFGGLRVQGLRGKKASGG
jgi:hypothetical protein